jgi:hypothetical protein
MNYTKPEVAVLGKAESVIAGPKPSTLVSDGGARPIHPAYDLDE